MAAIPNLLRHSRRSLGTIVLAICIGVAGAGVLFGLAEFVAVTWEPFG